MCIDAYAVYLSAQTFILTHRHQNMLTDGLKWKVRGLSKLPQKNPLYRRSLYFLPWTRRG